MSQDNYRLGGHLIQWAAYERIARFVPETQMYYDPYYPTRSTAFLALAAALAQP